MAKKKPVRKTRAEKARPFAVVLVEAGDDYYVQVSERDHSVVGFDTVEAGVSSIELAYERNHARGYEASMSACVNWIYYHRAVVALKSVDHLRKKLLPDVPDSELKLFTLSHVSGFMTGIMADKTKARRAWKTAAKPRLISQ